jgi:choline/glycine/proline betaine transport protein
MNVVLAFCVGILLSKFGRLRLGGPDAEPEFSILG